MGSHFLLQKVLKMSPLYIFCLTLRTAYYLCGFSFYPTLGMSGILKFALLSLLNKAEKVLENLSPLFKEESFNRTRSRLFFYLLKSQSKVIIQRGVHFIFHPLCFQNSCFRRGPCWICIALIPPSCPDCLQETCLVPPYFSPHVVFSSYPGQTIEHILRIRSIFFSDFSMIRMILKSPRKTYPPIGNFVSPPCGYNPVFHPDFPFSP